MKLLLLRHADAQEGDLDFERPLSPKGITQLVNVADALRPYFAPSDLMVCSPSRRTRQSAQLLLTRDCPITLRVERVLYEQQDVALLLELIAKHQTPTTLWIVGHDPSLSALLQRLTHTSLTLGKGDFAVLEQDKNPLAFSLVSYQKATALQLRTSQTFTDAQSMQRLLALAMQCDVWAASWMTQPQDVERLHQWRLHMRRLESLLVWMKPAIAKKELRPLSTKVHALNQALSTMRDLDRFLALNEPWLSAKVREQAIAKRSALQAKWINTEIPLWTPLVQELSLRNPHRTRNLAAAFEKRLHTYQNDFRTLSMHDQQAVHRLRLQGKILANWMELFPQLDHPWMHARNTLKAQLKCMGELHDFECASAMSKKWSGSAKAAKAQNAAVIKTLRKQL
ncbi:MAG: CHAD domain-containing protein, partial [Erysipelotrichaceae bacterium]